MRTLIKPKYLLLIVFIGTISISFTQSGFYRKIANSQSLINQVYTQIFSTYVDQLDPETFTKSSINSITENLDPYTTLLVEDEQYNINLLTDGKYGGVGIQLGYRNKEMTVISPMIDSPAQKAGIVGGDIIIKIDEADVKDLSFNDAAAKIRGKRGTKVKLTVKRYGYDDTIEFTLTRSRIDVKDVTYADMISSTTGYIRLNRFSRFTPRDFQNELLQIFIENNVSLIRGFNINNLLDNSIKYAKKVQISITKSNSNIFIKIEDDGPGIPEKEYDNVFKPFYKIDKGRADSKSSVGLGLSIASDIIRSHGGNIKLAKSSMNGLEVKIFLPF